MMLSDISLKDFIDVYFGDFSKAGGCTEEEQLRAASEMCMEYFSIVGGKNVSVQIAKRDKRLRISIRESVLDACEQLVSWGFASEALSVLESMGYKVDEAMLSDKIDQLRKMNAYTLKKMEEPVHEELTREHFIRERCFIMGHLKMHIDEHVFKAKEYAYLVRQVSDEIEELRQSVKKK